MSITNKTTSYRDTDQNWASVIFITIPLCWTRLIRNPDEAIIKIDLADSVSAMSAPGAPVIDGNLVNAYRF